METLNYQIIYDFVDSSLLNLAKSELMYSSYPNMPIEMRDNTKSSDDDWIAWKAIESTVTNEEISLIEQLSGYKFPYSFKLFLQYKHFYKLLCLSGSPEVVSFFRHGIYEWKKEWTTYYKYDFVKQYLLPKGFLPFADYEDWGIICFDTNKAIYPQEYPIVMIDHDLLADNPLPYKEFANDFVDMIQKYCIDSDIE